MAAHGRHVLPLAIVNIRRPQVHKRLMLLLMVGIMTPGDRPGIHHLFFAPPGLAGPPPPFRPPYPPDLVADLLLVVAMVHDLAYAAAGPHPVLCLRRGWPLVAEQLGSRGALRDARLGMSIAKALPEFGGVLAALA